MLFNLSIRPGEGESYKMFACWDQKTRGSLATILGQFRYYQFLRTIFWDFSSSFREGAIEFCHPGDGNLCVSWQLADSFTHADFDHNVAQGLKKVNHFDAGRYKDLFGIDIKMKAIESNGQGNFAISIMHKHTAARKHVLN